MPVLLILGAIGALIAELVKAVTPEAVKALKDLVRVEGDKINLKYPELGVKLNALNVKLAASPHDPTVLAELSAFSVLIHDTIRRDYPPDVSGDQSSYEDRLHTDAPAVVEGTETGLPGGEKPI